LAVDRCQKLEEDPRSLQEGPRRQGEHLRRQQRQVPAADAVFQPPKPFKACRKPAADIKIIAAKSRGCVILKKRFRRESFGGKTSTPLHHRYLDVADPKKSPVDASSINRHFRASKEPIIIHEVVYAVAEEQICQILKSSVRSTNRVRPTSHVKTTLAFNVDADHCQALQARQTDFRRATRASEA
jgi:hypothetical protein